MKVRNDFVTNSSSSSYILALENDISELTQDELAEWLNEDAKPYAEELLKTLKTESEKISQESLIDELMYDILYEIQTLYEIQYGRNLTRNELKKISRKYANELVSARTLNKQLYETCEFSAENGKFDQLMDMGGAFKKMEHIFYMSHH